MDILLNPKRQNTNKFQNKKLNSKLVRKALHQYMASDPDLRLKCAKITY